MQFYTTVINDDILISAQRNVLSVNWQYMSLKYTLRNSFKMYIMGQPQWGQHECTSCHPKTESPVYSQIGTSCLRLNNNNNKLIPLYITFAK